MTKQKSNLLAKAQTNIYPPTPATNKDASMLFFSGGTAINPLAKSIKQFTSHSMYLVSPFDSGGSSAVIRHHFNMPAVGDLRSRMVALADEHNVNTQGLITLFRFRFPKLTRHHELHAWLRRMAEGADPLINKVALCAKSTVLSCLASFVDAMPASFDLRGASVGNLILAGGYLRDNRVLVPTIKTFCRLLGVQGFVNIIAEDNFHLMATLDNGLTLIGQHRITGKEVDPICSKINHLTLVASSHGSDKPVHATMVESNQMAIQQAQLICYPPGSFYTSIIANLLPCGVADAIAANPCPKVYIPNRGKDPEQVGMSLCDQVKTLLTYLRIGSRHETDHKALLNYVLLDEREAMSDELVACLADNGVELLTTDLVSDPLDTCYDNDKLASYLVRLISERNNYQVDIAG